MPEQILELAEPVVINRAAVSTREELAAQLAGTRFEQELLAGWCEVPSVEVSSTAIRAALSAHEKSDLAGLVHSEVASFIRQHNLYTGRRAP